MLITMEMRRVDVTSSSFDGFVDLDFVPFFFINLNDSAYVPMNCWIKS